ILNTLRLKSEGVLQPCEPVTAKHYPAQYRDPDGEWFGFAARARVLLVNTDLVEKVDYPQSLDDLVAAKWSGKVGVAKPLFGTTASHAACLFAANGKDAAEEFLTRLAENANVYPGNKQVALAVSRGEIAIGLTDTDDAIVEIEAARPVTIVYPDQQDGGCGTLFIPNSLALLKGARHGENGKRLIEFLLRPDTEQLLADGDSAQIPLNVTEQSKTRIETPRSIRAMEVDFAEAARLWTEAATFVRQAFAK
ncbi:extracellular solute-binding protein, partial [Planctomycetota bacterium]